MDVALMAAFSISPPFQKELQWDDGLPSQALSVSLNRMKVRRTRERTLRCLRVDPPVVDVCELPNCNRGSDEPFRTSRLIARILITVYQMLD